MDFERMGVLAAAAKAHAEGAGMRLAETADEVESAINDLAQITGVRSIDSLTTAKASLMQLRDAIGRMTSVQRQAVELLDEFLR